MVCVYRLESLWVFFLDNFDVLLFTRIFCCFNNNFFNFFRLGKYFKFLRNSTALAISRTPCVYFLMNHLPRFVGI